MKNNVMCKEIKKLLLNIQRYYVKVDGFKDS